MKAFGMAFRVATLILCFSAAGAQAGERITVWAMGAEGKLIRQAADLFESRNPGVRVITQSIPWTGAHEKLVTAVIGDMAPDISQMGTTWMPEFKAMGAIEPLTGLVKGSTIKPGDFFPGALESNFSGGEWYGIPWYVDTRVLFYRSDLAKKAGYDAPPEDWEGFYRFSKALLAAKESGYSLSLPTNDWQIFLMFYWQSGGELLQGGEPLTPGSFERTVAYLKRFFDEKLSPLEGGREMDLLTAFESGHFPAFISGPWMISQLETSKPGLNGRWATARLPGGERRASFMGGCNLVMFRNSGNKPLAWKFMEFLSTPEMQARWYEISGDLPANRKAWNAASLAGNKKLSPFRKELETAKAPPQIPEWESVAAAIDDAVEEALYGKTEPSAAREKLSADIAGILKKSERTQSAAFKIAVSILLCLLPVTAVFLYLRKKGGDAEKKRVQYAAFLFIMPAMAVLTVFLFIPILGSFTASMTNWNMYGINDFGKVAFIGLENYSALFSDRIFLAGLRNTLVFAFIGVPLGIFVSLSLAIALNAQILRFKAFFRVSYFIPVITTMVAVAIIWRWLYNPEFGIFNMLLSSLGLPAQNWLSNKWLALPSLIVMAVWKGFGYNTMIFLAALQSIPESLYESIDIDGASWSQKFWYITLPMLRNTFFFITVTTTIGYLQFFAEPYIMTGGGPMNATMSVVLHMYRHGFKFYNLGYASAMAYALFAVVFVFTFMQFRVQKRKEEAA